MFTLRDGGASVGLWRTRWAKRSPDDANDLRHSMHSYSRSRGAPAGRLLSWSWASPKSRGSAGSSCKSLRLRSTSTLAASFALRFLLATFFFSSSSSPGTPFLGPLTVTTRSAAPSIRLMTIFGVTGAPAAGGGGGPLCVATLLMVICPD